MTGHPALRVFAVDWRKDSHGATLEGLITSRSMELNILYPRRSGVIDVTEVVQLAVREAGVQRGIAHLQLLHNSAALFLGPASETLQEKYLQLMSDLVPEKDSVDREATCSEDCAVRSAAPALRSALLGISVSLQLEEFTLVLGESQRVVLGEFDGGQERTIRILLMGV